MSSADESRCAPNGEEELDTLDHIGGGDKLHSQDGKSADAILSS